MACSDLEEGELSSMSSTVEHRDSRRSDVSASSVPSKRAILPSPDSGEATEGRAVLPVAAFDETFTVGSIPESGEQYLALVRHERSALPPILTASGSGVSVLKSVRDLLVHPTSSSLEINRELVDKLVADFANIPTFHKEAELSDDLPALNDRHAWLLKLYGLDHADPKKPAKHEWRSLLCSLRPETAFRILCFHNTWLEEIDPNLMQLDALPILLALIDRRLTSGQLASLRTLGRHCTQLLDDEEDKPDAYRSLQQTVVVVAKCFGQHDLISIHDHSK